MVSSAKISLNTGIPSAGQPVPVKGLQVGEEYGRRPTNCKVCPVPFTICPVGMWNLKPEGTVTLHCASCRNGPHWVGDPYEVTLFGFKLYNEIMSKHVCGFE